MDQIGLALSRRKLPRKPFSRRVCLARCTLDSVLPPPSSFAFGPTSVPSVVRPPPLPPAHVIILLLRNILETPVGFAKPL